MPYALAPQKHTIAVTTVFQKGKIQLPAEIRKAFNVKDGDKIVWVIIDGKYVVEKA
jgi:AbrB family looped-hinge helix DNA binding protein